MRHQSRAGDAVIKAADGTRGRGAGRTSSERVKSRFSYVTVYRKQVDARKALILCDVSKTSPQRSLPLLSSLLLFLDRLVCACVITFAAHNRSDY